MILFLASTSPRRQEILAALGLAFRVIPGSFQEVLPVSHPRPVSLARNLAREKMNHSAPQAGPGLKLTADTLVYSGQAIFGKPGDREDARRMLGALSGRTHSVATALCIQDLQTGGTLTAAAVTRVTFDSIPPLLLEEYLAQDEWRDKAGAYGIQGRAAAFIRGIHGCFFNVVGFPVNLFARILQRFGYRLSDFQPADDAF